MEIDTNLLVARISAKKLHKTEDNTENAIFKNFLTLYESQLIPRFLSFGPQIICLGWVFMRKLYTFGSSYTHGCSRFAKRRILSEVFFD